MQLKELQLKSHGNAVEKGFWRANADVGTKLMLIVSEISEALEEYRTNPDVSHVYEKDGKPEGFGVELADAVIRIADLAEWARIDLDNLIDWKMKYNASRPHMHGGKSC